MKKLLPILLLAFVLSGCVTVPQTSLSTPIGVFKFPKDVELEGLEIVKAGNDVTIRVAKYKARNNPEVIAASGEYTRGIIESSLTGGASIAGEVAGRLKP